MTNRNPDVSQYPLGRHGRPIVPREEWSPFRPICAEEGYDLPHCQWRRHVGPLGRSKTVPSGVFMSTEKVRANWPA